MGNVCAPPANVVDPPASDGVLTGNGATLATFL